MKVRGSEDKTFNTIHKARSQSQVCTVKKLKFACARVLTTKAKPNDDNYNECDAVENPVPEQEYKK